MTEKEKGLYEKFKHELCKEFVLIKKQSVDSTSTELDKISNVVRSFFGYTKENFCERKRTHRIAYARQLYCKLAHEHTKATYSEIAGVIGQDHSTVIYSIRVITGYIETEPRTKEDYEALKKIIEQK